MGTTVGSLAVNVSTNHKAFTKGLTQVRAQAAQTEGTFGSLAKKALGLFAGVALVSKLRSVADEFDKIGKMSNRLNLSAEATQRWALAAQLGGESLDAIERSSTKMLQSIDSANRGTRAQAEAFQRMGLSAADLRLQDRETQLLTVANALAKVENSTDRAGIATTIFGRTGLRMQNIMEAMAADMDHINSKHVLTREQSARIETANDSITKLADTVTVSLGDSLEDIAPVISTFVNGVGDITKKISGERVDMNFMQGAFPLLMDSIEQLVGAQEELKPTSLTDVVPEFDPAEVERAVGMYEDLTKAVENFGLTSDQAKLAELEGLAPPEVLANIRGVMDELDRMEAVKKNAEDLTKTMESVSRHGDQLTRSLRSPFESAVFEVSKLNLLLERGAINADTYARGIAKTSQELWDATEAKDEFDQVGRSNVGAVQRGTVEGFSAVREGREAAYQAKQQREKAQRTRERQLQVQEDLLRESRNNKIEVRELDL